MITFEKTTNGSILVTKNGVKFSLPSTMYIIPTRYNSDDFPEDYHLEISNGNDYKFVFDYREVALPVSTDRNDLVTKLGSDFFFKVDNGGGGQIINIKEDILTINSNNQIIFNLTYSPNPIQSLMLFYNGQLRRINIDYTLSSNIINWISTDYNIEVNNELIARYNY